MDTQSPICCICFLTDEVDHAATDPLRFWNCALCGTRCHLTCITTWAQSNHNRYRSTFSCPVCRHCFDLSTLPALHLPQEPTPPPRPSLSSFIAAVLHPAEEPQPSDLEAVEPHPSSTRRRRQPPIVINGTGSISIERLTIINKY